MGIKSLFAVAVIVVVFVGAVVGQQQQQKIINFVSCVEEVGDGCVAHFGYENPNAFVVEIAVGVNNSLVGGVSGTQVTVFEMGVYRDAFQVQMECDDSVVWTLTTVGGSMLIAVADDGCSDVCPRDCLNVTFGTTVFDECGVCGGGSVQDTCPRCGLDVVGIVCDVTSGQPDFHAGIPVHSDFGIALDLLKNSTPQYAGLVGNNSTHGQRYFNDWFHEHHGVNQCAEIKFSLNTLFSDNSGGGGSQHKRNTQCQDNGNGNNGTDNGCKACIHNADCNDHLNCTTDTCVNHYCAHTPVNCGCSNPCSSNVCSEAMGGKCVETPKNCNDLNPCTNDSCNRLNGKCVNTPIPGCVPPCATAADCDNHNLCSINTCVGGKCYHVLKNCTSSNKCQVGHCDASTGNCMYMDVMIDDCNPCTTDICNPQTGVITHPPIVCAPPANKCVISLGCVNGTCMYRNKTCDNANACTIGRCSLDTGACVQDPLPAINDGNPCTDDTCVNGVISHTPRTCNDGKNCTIDSCDIATGQCVNAPVVCNASDVCMHAYCDESCGGECKEIHIPHCGRQCEQNSDCPALSNCTVGTCSTDTWMCVYTPRVCRPSYDLCTLALCDDAHGGCYNTPVVCDTSDWCRPYMCNPNDGSCILNAPNCNSGNPCKIDSCDSANKTCVSVDKVCTSSDPCFTAHCSIEQGGLCVLVPVPVDDENPCTNDYCLNGVIYNVPMNCDDGRNCTDDSCVAGQCLNVPIQCPSEDKCRPGHCDEARGGVCVYEEVNCDTGLKCLIGTCNPDTGVCVRTHRLCDDGNVCSVDSCSEQSDSPDGCVYEFIPGCAETTYCPCDPDFDNAHGWHLESWSFYMPGVGVFSVLDEPYMPNWTEHLNGTVTFVARIGTLESSAQYDVFFVLSSPTAPGSPPAGSPVYFTSPITDAWVYYTQYEFAAAWGVTGTIAEGVVIVFTERVSTQIGVGANGNDFNFGAGAFFNWTVQSQPLHYPALPDGSDGAFGLDLNACPPVTWTPMSSGCEFYFNDTEYYPIDGMLFGNENGAPHNTLFTLQFHLVFVYEAHQYINITHSDDVFVFVNNRLVIDGGGLYGSTPGQSSVLLDNVRPALIHDNFYRLDVFFANRQTVTSVFQVFTNVPFHNGLCVDECGIPNGDNSACSGCDGVPNSGVQYDRCGVCGGNGTTCEPVPCPHVNITIESHSGCIIRSVDALALTTEFCYQVSAPSEDNALTAVIVDFQRYEQCTLRQPGTCASIPVDTESAWCDLFNVDRLEPTGKWQLSRIMDDDNDQVLLQYCANFSLVELQDCQSSSVNGAPLIVREDDPDTLGEYTYSGTMFTTVTVPVNCDDELACDLPALEECCRFEISLNADGTTSSEFVHEEMDLQAKLLHVRHIGFDVIITIQTCVFHLEQHPPLDLLTTYLGDGEISHVGETGYPLDVSSVTQCIEPVATLGGRCCQVWTFHTVGADRDDVLSGHKLFKFNLYTHGQIRLPGWMWLNPDINNQEHIEHISQSMSAHLEVYRDRLFTVSYDENSEMSAFIDCEPLFVLFSLDVDENWANEFRLIVREIRLCYSDDPVNYPIYPFDASNPTVTGCNSPGGAHIKEIDLYIRDTNFQNQVFRFEFLSAPPYATSQVGFTFNSVPLSQGKIEIEIDWYSVIIKEISENSPALQDITYTYNGEPYVHEGTHTAGFRVECKPHHTWTEGHCAPEEGHEGEKEGEGEGNVFDLNRAKIAFLGLLLAVIILGGCLCCFGYMRKPVPARRRRRSEPVPAESIVVASADNTTTTSNRSKKVSSEKSKKSKNTAQTTSFTDNSKHIVVVNTPSSKHHSIFSSDTDDSDLDLGSDVEEHSMPSLQYY
jgi:fibro-slime domain-containing protein